MSHLRYLAFFVLAAVALTWPLAIGLDSGLGARGDYYDNLWNAWWMRHALSELKSPWWTDYLWHPGGISLARHTLSPLNALSGAALGTFLSPDAAYGVLILAHLVLAGWAFFLLARYLTGSAAGAVLGGLVFSFSPFHFYYLCQINVFSFGFIPLALYFLFRARAEGGWKPALWTALSVGAIAATSEYYVVYFALLAAFALLLGKWMQPSVPPRVGALRVFTTTAVGGLAALVVSAPLLVEVLRGKVEIQTGVEGGANDLLGYVWLGGPEQALVAWPTMLGYSTLLLAAFSLWRLTTAWPWIVVGGTFLVLSFGDELVCGGKPTGISLPYGWIADLPVLELLRKPSRAFFGLQFAVAMLVVVAWQFLAARFSSARSRAAAWAVPAIFVMAELNGLPVKLHTSQVSPWFRELARDDGARALVEFPQGESRFDVTEGGSVSVELDPRAEFHLAAIARTNLHQIFHGKRIPTGYTTVLVLSDEHLERLDWLVHDYHNWVWGKPTDFLERVRSLDVDFMIQDKTAVRWREPDARVDGRTIWKPFFWGGRTLVHVRQLGPFVESSIPEAVLQRARSLFSAAFGPPVYEDDSVIAFRVRERP